MNDWLEALKLGGFFTFALLCFWCSYLVVVEDRSPIPRKGYRLAMASVVLLILTWLTDIFHEAMTLEAEQIAYRVEVPL